MHTFLMVLLWVVLGLLALLAVLLILPAAVAVEYKQGEFTARLKLLGIFSFHLYPMKEKADRKKKKTPPQPESAPKEQPAKPEPKLHMTFEKVQGILSAAGAFMRRVFRALHFTGIVFILPIHRDDAAQTAVAYGRAQAWVGGAAAALQNFLNLSFRQVRILADFTGEITAGPYFSCKIGASPIIMITAALYALVQLKNEHVL